MVPSCVLTCQVGGRTHILAKYAGWFSAHCCVFALFAAQAPGLSAMATEPSCGKQTESWSLIKSRSCWKWDCPSALLAALLLSHLPHTWGMHAPWQCSHLSQQFCAFDSLFVHIFWGVTLSLCVQCRARLVCTGKFPFLQWGTMLEMHPCWCHMYQAAPAPPLLYLTGHSVCMPNLKIWVLHSQTSGLT